MQDNSRLGDQRRVVLLPQRLSLLHNTPPELRVSGAATFTAAIFGGEVAALGALRRAVRGGCGDSAVTISATTCEQHLLDKQDEQETDDDEGEADGEVGVKVSHTLIVGDMRQEVQDADGEEGGAREDVQTRQDALHRTICAYTTLLRPQGARPQTSLGLPTTQLSPPSFSPSALVPAGEPLRLRGWY